MFGSKIIAAAWRGPRFDVLAKIVMNGWLWVPANAAVKCLQEVVKPTKS